MNLKDKNIVLIVVDTLSAHNMSLYGYERETDPFLKELADENSYFEKAYANAPWTLPSHASLFSGKLPNEAGTHSEDLYFGTSSFVEELQHTHQTIGISNNSLISPEFGFDVGFDFFEYGKGVYFEANQLPTMKAVWNSKEEQDSTFKKISDILKTFARNRDWKSLLEAGNFVLNKFLRNEYDFETNLSMIDSGANSANSLVREQLDEEPFFLFLNYMEPHLPYNPPSGRFDYPWIENLGELKGIFEDFYNDSSINIGVDESFNLPLRKLYDAEIRYVDTKIEEMYDYIDSNFDDTIFIIVGDHGEMVGHRGIVEHHFGIWERLVRVPMIIAGNSIDNQVIEGPVSLKNLKELLLDNKDLSEMSNEHVVSEYKGAKGFRSRMGQLDMEDVDKYQARFLNNRSKAIFSREKGFISNSHLDDEGVKIMSDSPSNHVNITEVDHLQKNLSELYMFEDLDY